MLFYYLILSILFVLIYFHKCCSGCVIFCHNLLSLSVPQTSYYGFLGKLSHWDTPPPLQHPRSIDIIVLLYLYAHIMNNVLARNGPKRTAAT